MHTSTESLDRAELRELQDERNRTEAFAEKAADLNNYGRALAQATNLEEIAAYCIQGISSLLSYDKTAYVEVGPSDETIISSTISDIPETDIRTIARRAIDTEGVVSTDADDGITSHSTLSVRIESATPDMGVLVTVFAAAATAAYSLSADSSRRTPSCSSSAATRASSASSCSRLRARTSA